MAEQDKKYLKVYDYYRNVIRSGSLAPGARLPSIRRRASELGYSRTTVEQAYMMLAADGYIISKPQSGFYVTDFLSHRSGEKGGTRPRERRREAIRYDFASAGMDPGIFRFDVWRRYMRNALRQDERLLTYGDSQGEPDLREALAGYLGKNRGVLCRPDSIVVGAGTQNLLQLLCPMIRDRKQVYFRGAVFRQGGRIFQDFDIPVLPGGGEPEPGSIAYIAPSRMTAWGDVLPVRDRVKLIRAAEEKDILILEDDYDSEFCYYSRPVPSIQGLDEAGNTVYLGTFSRMLLPSIRLSFMVLPEKLLDKYREVGTFYNQTASKAEQIALCQFIRDGNLESQIRKTKKVCVAKQEALIAAIRDAFGDTVAIHRAESGFLTGVDFGSDADAAMICRRAAEQGIAVRPGEGGTVLFSFAAMESGKFPEGIAALRAAILRDGVQ